MKSNSIAVGYSQDRCHYCSLGMIVLTVLQFFYCDDHSCSSQVSQPVGLLSLPPLAHVEHLLVLRKLVIKEKGFGSDPALSLQVLFPRCIVSKTVGI